MYSLLKGVFYSMSQKEEKKTLLIGLDGSGKSTFVNKIKSQLDIIHSVRAKIKPTMGLNVFTYEKNNIKYTIWDIAGGKNYRQVWHSYIKDADFIIYMIDGSNHSRLEEDRSTIRSIIEDCNMKDKSILFYINKNDIDGYDYLLYADMIRGIKIDYTINIYIDECSCMNDIDMKYIHDM